MAGEPARHEQASTWRTSVVRHPHLAHIDARGQPDAGAETARATWHAHAATNTPPPSLLPQKLHANPHDLSGLASFYWQEQQTASGERFDKAQLTAAHRTLPFGTRVKVNHLDNGRSVIVRINDRGPFKPGRVIDLSHAAADALAMTGHGLAPVRLEVVE